MSSLQLHHVFYKLIAAVNAHPVVVNFIVVMLMDHNLLINETLHSLGKYSLLYYLEYLFHIIFYRLLHQSARREVLYLLVSLAIIYNKICSSNCSCTYSNVLYYLLRVIILYKIVQTLRCICRKSIGESLILLLALVHFIETYIKMLHCDNMSTTSVFTAIHIQY